MTTILYARKEVSALPATLTPDTIYAVRRGTGFDLYISDSTGLIAHKVNNTDDPLKSPTFTYGSGGELVRIDYSDGTAKAFTYSAGVLTQIVQTLGPLTVKTKTFTYNSGGQLTGITEL